MKADPLKQLRRICLDLPEATEKEAWSTPTFRVGNKMFAMFVNDHHHDGRVALWCKGTLELQEILIASDPKRYFRPAYVGHKGWIGVCLDGKVDWDEVANFVEESYRMTAPKRLAARVGELADGHKRT